MTSAVCAATVYDLTAKVFVSQVTADGYHVGDHVCYSDNFAVDCFPDKPHTDYRFELSGDRFATVRFVSTGEDGLDALALIFESKEKDTTVRFRIIESNDDPSKPYTIGVPYADADATGKKVQREARYRVYPDAKR